MGSTVNKNQQILQKSQSEVLSQKLDQSKSFIRTSTITQTQKQLEVDSSIKKSLQQSIKGDDCDDSPLQELDTKSQKQNPQEMIDYDLNKELCFEARAINSKIKMNMSNSTVIQAMISLKANDLLVQEHQRTGLDLVCIIDKSGSMSGTKLKMVQSTLYTLINLLSEKDRFSVIVFDSVASKLFKLKKVTEQRKISITQKILSINAGGGTKISNGLIKGFEILQNRQSINQVTSIFLLSDGQDNITESKLDQLFSGVNFPFTIHTFGYGNDHDAKIMTKISKIGNGNFYFIKNLSLLDEFFLDALGSLLTVVGQLIKIEINCNPQPPFHKIIISKTFGSMWQEKVSQKEYQINLPVIASGLRKDFVFELDIPKFKNKIKNKEQIVTIVNFTLQLQCPKTKMNIEKTCQLNLIFCNDKKQLLNIQKDLEVAVQYYRVKGTDIIQEARLACENQKFEEAKKIIQNIILEIKSDDKIKNLSQIILEDLEQALEGCNKEQYHNYGQTMMMQQVSNNYQQSGLSAEFNQDGHQFRSQNHYSNSFTRNLISTSQSTKYCSSQRN